MRTPWRLAACCLAWGIAVATVWPQADKQRTATIHVSAEVAAARIDHMIEPVYPKDAHVQGTIVLHAVIDTDGSIQSMEYMSGPTRLMRAALDAAHLWHYRPMKINGHQVEVDTTINVVFALDAHGHLKPQPRIWPNVAARLKDPGISAPAD